MTPQILNQLAEFDFTFEVRDTLSPSKDQVIGFCQLPAAPFAKATNGYNEENVYPLVGHDDLIEIWDFLGKAIGWLKVTLAFGTAIQVNRFVQVLEERENAKTWFGISSNQTLNKEWMQEGSPDKWWDSR